MSVQIGSGQRLRPYRAIVAARVRMLLQYRAAALAGFGTQVFWGLIKVMVLFAFFGLPLLGLVEWALPPPGSLAGGALFLVSLAFRLLLSTAITVVLHVSLLWTVSGDGFNRLMLGVVPVFSGLVIPLPLFPEWLQPVLLWQPFRGIADVPFRLYSGHIAPGDGLMELVMQAGWTALIIAFGVWLLGVARRCLVVQGG